MIVDYFKKVKWATVLLSILYFALGLCLVVIPSFTKELLVIIFGAGLIVLGIVSIIEYFLYGYEPFGVLSGVLYIMLGIVFIAFNGWIAGFIAFAFGIYFFIKAIFRIQDAFDYRRAGAKYWWADALFGVALLALGIVIICNPFDNNWLLIFLGIVIMIEAVANLISTFVISRKIEKHKTNLKEFFKGCNVVELDESSVKKHSDDVKNEDINKDDA